MKNDIDLPCAYAPRAGARHGYAAR